MIVNRLQGLPRIWTKNKLQDNYFGEKPGKSATNLAADVDANLQILSFSVPPEYENHTIPFCFAYVITYVSLWLGLHRPWFPFAALACVIGVSLLNSANNPSANQTRKSIEH